MVRKIVEYPDPLLREKTIPVSTIGEGIFTLVEDMITTMLEKDGVGLAANQVGSRHRIFVLNTTPHDEDPSPVVFINPVILDADEDTVDEEGCLSFPGLYLHIPRSRTVRVQAQSLYKEDLVYDAHELLARAIQHEIDHLDGVVFIDHALPEEQEAVQKYLEQLRSEES
jgi:peptide deformylase